MCVAGVGVGGGTEDNSKIIFIFSYFSIFLISQQKHML